MRAEEVHSAISELHEKCISSHFDRNDENLPIMYHYTSSKAALSIIKNLQLRLTDIRFVNDPLEITKAVSIGHPIVCEELKKLNENTSAHRALLITWHYFLNAIRQYIEPRIIIDFEERLTVLSESLRIRIIKGARLREPRVFMAAFSSSEDDLTQWRAYANQGKGYNIGFDFRNSPFLQQTQYSYGFNKSFCGIVKTNYASDEKKAHYFSDWLGQLISFLNENSETSFFSSEDITDIDAHLIVSLMHCLLYDVIACKNDHYKSENEWRIFQVVSSDANTPAEDGFYLKNNIFIPYKILSLKNEINSVKTGPANLSPLTQIGIEYLLKSKGIQNYLIDASEIKYRG